MKILIVEDEKSLAKALKAILENSKYSVDVVYNGDDAVTFITGTKYDAVILDLMIPGLDGIGVIKKVRKNGIDVPILILSAKAEVDDKVLGLDSGANDYLSKPFAPKELLARIRALTRVKDQEDSSVIIRGNTKLDLKSYEISTNKSSFRLTNKEFQIAELFFRRPGEIISTERLIEHIWGYESNADVSLVWVYISYLRKKLTSMSSDVEIKAARNAGYYLECPNGREA